MVTASLRTHRLWVLEGVSYEGEGTHMEDIGMGKLLANSYESFASELVPVPFRKGQDGLLGNETTRKAGRSTWRVLE